MWRIAKNERHVLALSGLTLIFGLFNEGVGLDVMGRRKRRVRGRVWENHDES